MNEKLKIGVLLNNYILPAWQARILVELNNSDYSKIVFVILNKTEIISNRHKERGLFHIAIRILEKIDRLIFKTRDDYYQRKDFTYFFKNLPEIIVNRNHIQNEDFDKNTINEIKDYNPDIIIKFGFHILKGDILKLPKYGIWAHSIDNPKNINSINSGFWEVIRNIPVTNSALVILNQGREKEELIFNSWESTSLFSINRNRNIVFWRSTLFIPRIIKGIHKYGDNYFNTLKHKFEKESTCIDGDLTDQSILTEVKDFYNFFWHASKHSFKKILYTDAFNWQLLVDFKNDNIYNSNNFSSFKKISPPKGLFWADPFVISKNDNFYIFVEEYIYKKNNGHISVLKLDDKGKLISNEKIIERPYHMSYPFIFKIDKTYYLIPETCENKTIELYKCTDFPYKWEFDRYIMTNISAVDTTIFHHDNKWWLFSSLDQTNSIPGSSTELFLFFTQDIFSGNWVSHPLNPIISDVRNARPAGKLFISEGKIYRPSQDCSVRYGKAFNLNQVTKLTSTEYDETLISVVNPIWDKKLKGTHTLNFDKDLTIIDVYSFRNRFLNK